MSPATEAALEVVETDTTRVAFMLQHAKRGQATPDVMLLGPLGARLTAAHTELVLAHPDDCLDIRVATHKTIDLVFRTEVYKLMRARRTRPPP